MFYDNSLRHCNMREGGMMTRCAILLLLILSQDLTRWCFQPLFSTEDIAVLQEKEYAVEVVRALYNTISKRTENVMNQLQSWLVLKKFIASPKAIPYVRQLITNSYHESQQDHMDIISAFIDVINNYDLDETQNRQDIYPNDRLEPEIQTILDEAKAAYQLTNNNDDTNKLDTVDDIADISDILADYADIINVERKPNSNAKRSRKLNPIKKKKNGVFNLEYVNDETNRNSPLQKDSKEKGIRMTPKDLKVMKHYNSTPNSYGKKAADVRDQPLTNNTVQKKVHRAVLDNQNESTPDPSYGFQDWNWANIAKWMGNIVGLGKNTDKETESVTDNHEDNTDSSEVASDDSQEPPKIHIIVNVDDPNHKVDTIKPVITVQVNSDSNKNISYTNHNIQSEDTNNEVGGTEEDMENTNNKNTEENDESVNDEARDNVDQVFVTEPQAEGEGSNETSETVNRKANIAKSNQNMHMHTALQDQAHISSSNGMTSGSSQVAQEINANSEAKVPASTEVPNLLQLHTVVTDTQPPIEQSKVAVPGIVEQEPGVNPTLLAQIKHVKEPVVEQKVGPVMEIVEKPEGKAEMKKLKEVPIVKTERKVGNTKHQQRRQS